MPSKTNGRCGRTSVTMSGSSTLRPSPSATRPSSSGRIPLIVVGPSVRVVTRIASSTVTSTTCPHGMFRSVPTDIRKISVPAERLMRRPETWSPFSRYTSSARAILAPARTAVHKRAVTLTAIDLLITIFLSWGTGCRQVQTSGRTGPATRGRRCRRGARVRDSDHSGMFPCFFGGFLSRFVSSAESARISLARVWRGRITSSMKPRSAAM